MNRRSVPALVSPTPSDAPDTGLICLVTLMRLMGLPVDPDALRHRFAPTGGVMGEVELLRCAKQMEIKARKISTTWDRLAKTPLSVTAEIASGKRKVIEYLLSPILKVRQESLGER
ncbi:MAG: hypothetical protein HQL51_05210 [Magnetococcales bacterium]|nr:hypothetical protein [Magnetococcales bacterium]